MMGHMKKVSSGARRRQAVRYASTQRDPKTSSARQSTRKRTHPTRTKGSNATRNITRECTRKCVKCNASTMQAERTQNMPETSQKTKHKKVIIAGGGIGGLCLALALQNRGIPFVVYEKVKEYRPFGGPIQLQCNALATLEAIDMNVAAEIQELGTITGDRINGLIDGKTGEWYLRFNTRKPAIDSGLPLTTVLNRYTLLDILRKAVKDEHVVTGKQVSHYEEQSDGRVDVYFSDGSKTSGDVLVASDGIHSNVRKQMRLNESAVYSGYTCYTATCDFEIEDIDTVGYQVYLGFGQYFVASDVGNGQTQWYAFQKQDAGQEDTSGRMKENLLEAFDGWSDDVLARFLATKEEDIEQRDIYDRRPIFKWVQGSTALLGDSAHAMQPNMGQGGCQAIEDAYVLASELSSTDDIATALRRYESKRVNRAAAIHGFARSAAMMTATWRPYIGSDPYDFYKYIPGMMKFWETIEQFKIPHPGKVIGQIAMMLSIDFILNYIACANPVVEEDRAPYCQVPGIGAPLRKIPLKAFKMKGIPGFAN